MSPRLSGLVDAVALIATLAVGILLVVLAGCGGIRPALTETDAGHSCAGATLNCSFTPSAPAPWLLS